MAQIEALGRDETVGCRAALVALVEDVHAPQDQLTEEQWQAADRVTGAIPNPPPSADDRVLAIALAVMSEVDRDTAEIATPDLRHGRDGRTAGRRGRTTTG